MLRRAALCLMPDTERAPMNTAIILATACLTLIGGLGGILAAKLGVPLPYMMGSMVTVAVVATLFRQHFPADYKFPQSFRLIFIAAIGVMIGAQVTADLIGMIPSMALSFAAITLFVPLAHGGNYLIFRHLGRYSPPTAFYCGTPGGLMESLAMGEEAGADIATLTMQQFLRIVLVISIVPIGLSLWVGAPVGSSGGQSLSHMAAFDFHTLPFVLLTALAGLGIGKLIRLPAWQLTGPLFAAAVISATGLMELDLPVWVISLCQVVLGVSLGTRFGGLTPSKLARGMGLGVISVGYMLGLGAGFVLLLRLVLDTRFDVLLISFAPGGVTEMALVALSLAANPAFVTAHHIWRIILTVIEIALLSKLRPFPPAKPD